jgi:hypothetical protein
MMTIRGQRVLEFLFKYGWIMIGSVIVIGMLMYVDHNRNMETFNRIKKDNVTIIEYYCFKLDDQDKMERFGTRFNCEKLRFKEWYCET